MRFAKPIAALAVTCAMVSARADVLQIPYASGKKMGTFTITLNNGSAISPDTVRIGSALTIVPYLAYSLLAVCNNSNELGLQIRPAGGGNVFRRFNRDSNWVGYTAPYLLSSNTFADSVPRLFSPAQPANLPKARGFVFAYPGDNNCMTETYGLDSNYRQLMFPTGGGYYSKLQIYAFTHTLPGPPPPQYQPKVLNTISVRYVINDTTDLSGNPVAILPAPSRAGLKAGLAATPDLYNPLGVRLKDGTGKFEARLPDSRRPRP